MANTFRTSTFALYNFESDNLKGDSIASNTLSAGTIEPSAASGDYKQGSGSASFTASNTEYYEIPDANWVGPLNSNDAKRTISICCWIKPTKDDYLMVFSKGTLQYNQRSFCVWIDNNQICQMSTGWSNGSQWQTKYNSIPITLNNWWHVTWAWRDLDKTWAIRVRDEDGNIHEDVTGTATYNIHLCDVPVRIGAYGGWSSEPALLFDGYMDELVIFDKFLSAEDSTNIAKGQYDYRNVAITPQTIKFDEDQTESGVMTWAMGFDREPYTSGTWKFDISFDYPTTGIYSLEYDSKWIKNTGWENYQGNIYWKECKIEPIIVYDGNTRLTKKQNYKTLEVGEWTWQDAADAADDKNALFVNVGESPQSGESGHFITPEPYEAYLTFTVNEGYRQSSFNAYKISSDIEILGNSTLTDTNSNPAATASVLDNLYDYPDGTVAVPFSVSNPKEFSINKVVALYNFEPGYLTTDSVGSNTLSAGGTYWTGNTASSISSAGSYRQGVGSAKFYYNGSNPTYYRISDEDCDFPLRYGCASNEKTISICAWIKLGTGANECILGKWRGKISSPNDNSFVFRVISSKLQLYCRHDQNGDTAADHLSTLTSHVWYHVTASYRDSDGRVALRVRDINGNVAGTDIDKTLWAAPGYYINIAKFPFEIGAYRYNDNPDGIFDGYMDELVIFNKFLSAEDSTNIAKGQYDFYSTMKGFSKTAYPVPGDFFDWSENTEDSFDISDYSGTSDSPIVLDGHGYLITGSKKVGTYYIVENFKIK